MTSSGRDRRHCYRCEVTIPMKFKIIGGECDETFQGVARNLSTGGMLIEVEPEYAPKIWHCFQPKKTRLVVEELSISKLDIEMLTVIDVAWKQDDTKEPRYFVGVSFVESNEQRDAFIKKYLGKL